MFRFMYQLMTVVSAVMVAGSTANAQSEARHPAPALAQTAIRDLRPFTHAAFIPVASDLSSIRFQGVKVVTIATKRRSIADRRYCDELAFGDPGGSLYCPFVQPETFTPAYQVTYSFDGEPLASDEYANRHFTFCVYFRPEEFDSEERDLLLKRKGSRADAAGVFRVSRSRELDGRLVIDADHSKFCEGNFVDGSWVHTNLQCEDIAKFKTITVPSDYITVQVDAAPSRGVAFASK
jgi:hypothetical protein